MLVVPVAAIGKRRQCDHEAGGGEDQFLEHGNLLG
jgi:hypothetical protein